MRTTRGSSATAPARPAGRPSQHASQERAARGHLRPRRGGLRPVARSGRPGRSDLRRVLGRSPAGRGRDRGGPDRDPSGGAATTRRGRRGVAARGGLRRCAGPPHPIAGESARVRDCPPPPRAHVADQKAARPRPGATRTAGSRRLDRLRRPTGVVAGLADVARERRPRDRGQVPRLRVPGPLASRSRSTSRCPRRGRARELIGREHAPDPPAQLDHERVGHPLKRRARRRVGVRQPALALAPRPISVIEPKAAATAARHRPAPPAAASVPSVIRQAR